MYSFCAPVKNIAYIYTFKCKLCFYRGTKTAGNSRKDTKHKPLAEKANTLQYRYKSRKTVQVYDIRAGYVARTRPGSTGFNIIPSMFNLNE